MMLMPNLVKLLQSRKPLKIVDREVLLEALMIIEKLEKV